LQHKLSSKFYLQSSKIASFGPFAPFGLHCSATSLIFQH